MGGRFFNIQIVIINVLQLILRGIVHAERCDGKILSLGGYYGNLCGRFSSPNHPSNYEAKDSCTWSIKVPSGYLVKLTFTDFDLENCTSCECDSVTISEGKPSETKVINKYCGQEAPPPIQASGRYLKVKFDSDSKRSKKGFTASYYALKVGKEGEDLIYTKPPSDICAFSESPTDGKTDAVNGHSIIIIAVLSTIAGIALISITAIVCLKKSRYSRRRRNSSQVPPTSGNPRQPAPTIPPPVDSMAPPTYSESVGNVDSNNRPPPYNVNFVPSL